MRDTRLHNDCDGGACVACYLDEQQERLQSDRRAWFDPSATKLPSLQECTMLEIEDAVKAMLSELA